MDMEHWAENRLRKERIWKKSNLSLYNLGQSDTGKLTEYWLSKKWIPERIKAKLISYLSSCESALQKCKDLDVNLQHVTETIVYWIWNERRSGRQRISKALADRRWAHRIQILAQAAEEIDEFCVPVEDVFKALPHIDKDKDNDEIEVYPPDCRMAVSLLMSIVDYLNKRDIHQLDERQKLAKKFAVRYGRGREEVALNWAIARLITLFELRTEKQHISLVVDLLQPALPTPIDQSRISTRMNAIKKTEEFAQTRRNLEIEFNCIRVEKIHT
jgi:hypothetical protein